MPYLLLLFIAMPIIEIAMFIQVGGQIGLLPTLAIVVLTAVVGTAMLQRQGRATLARARERLGSGQMPAEEMLEGLLLVVGGVLLLTPGFFTDAFGFACLIPISRRWIAARLAARSVRVVAGGASGPAGGPGPGVGRFRQGSAGDATSGPDSAGGAAGFGGSAGARAGGRASDGTGDVIEGDYRRVD